MKNNKQDEVRANRSDPTAGAFFDVPDTPAVVEKSYDLELLWEGDNEDFCGTLYELEGSVLVRYNGRAMVPEIPETVTVIAAGAFDGIRAVQTVVLPASVERIEAGAFRDCPALQRMIVPETVTEIAPGAFADCPLLQIDTMEGSRAAEYGEAHGIPVVVDGRYAQRAEVRQQAERARRAAAEETAERMRREEDERLRAELEEADLLWQEQAERRRQVLEDAERVRREAEEAEQIRREEARRRREAEAAERRRVEEQRMREAQQRSQEPERDTHERNSELTVRRNRYDDLTASIEVQEQIIAANKGWFGARAQTRKGAQQKLDALLQKRKKEFPHGRP